MGNPTKIGNLVTKVQKCEADHILGEGYGLLQQFVRLTVAEAVSGEATRKCPITDREIKVKVATNSEGYCQAGCLGVGCEYLG